MHNKTDVRTRSRKGGQNEQRISEKWLLKWSHFPSQIADQFDAKNNRGKVMGIDENTMRNLSSVFIFFEIGFHENTYFANKVNVRKPYVSSSRIRVGEVSLHYQVARNLYTIDKKSMQSRCA